MTITDIGREQSETTRASGLPGGWGANLEQPKVDPGHMALPGPQAEEYGEKLKALSRKPRIR